MQKIITITSRTDIIKEGEDFKESQYPELNKYLEDGYIVSQIIPIIKPADLSYRYAITFLLNKND